MNPDRFERATEILRRILDRPESERQAILEETCGGDPELRAEVESMLAHDGNLTSSPTESASPASGSPDTGTSPSTVRLSTSPFPEPLGAAPTIATSAASGPLAQGTLLGNRYRIVNLLGRGGMGEVWRAYDLKLQVDVALKFLHPGLFADTHALELLRNEVRSAREVISPNVCRIFDLAEEEECEFVSMEYIDGQTLLALLKQRAPLPIPEATRIAAQFLAGLEAIHHAGLVHRDVKPENIMITRTGRVLLMDFGIARGIAEDQRGTVSGTPAYMAPEQWHGEAVDARADIFAAGVTLAEMIAPAGLHDHTSRRSIWEAVRQDPVRLFHSPWRRVLEQALAAQASERYASARELVRALEEVPQRIAGAEEKRPYPGLASFTKADAEFFFGRELEVEAVWKKLQRSNLLAIIGPSGAGKTSFLQAGLLPAEATDWRHILFRPGTSPFVALTEALVTELAAGQQATPELTDQLLRIEDPTQAIGIIGRWRQGCGQALVVVDQFEELFTLCGPETQASFTDLLGRLADDADVHALLVLRDDFIFRCHEYAGLAPIFSELTPIGPPGGGALRRALVQPALLCGYRFEDESLADDMLAAIEGERGALPMLAFTAARLWENRDRDRGLLAREAYERIGGVSGALAQHAEATLERIGTEREPIVREIFRNLVTAQHTRCVIDSEELLSVFPEQRRGDAREVLGMLVDARLLTSFEVEGPDGKRRHRIELVHESLLQHWPRLVRWQTQDVEGALLRDQLRQAARLWVEKGKPADLLWTGTSFREYQVWRERYPGGLSAVEESFASAMTVLAGRRRRRRRVAVTAALAVLVGTTLALSLLWRKSVSETRRAEIEARRSEAANLLSLGRLRLGDHPNAALAYAIASLERADSEPARRFAVETLWQGPPALFLPTPANTYSAAWSSDGRWLTAGGADGLFLLERETGKQRQLSPAWEQVLGMTTDNQRLVTLDQSAQPRTVLRIRTLPDGQLERTLEIPEGMGFEFLADDLLTYTPDPSVPSGEGSCLVCRLSLADSTMDVLGRWESHGLVDFWTDPTVTWLASIQDGHVVQQWLNALSAPPRVLGTHEGQVRLWVRPWHDRFVTSDDSGEVRVWNVASGRLERTLKSPADARRVGLDPKGRFLAAGPWEVATGTRSLYLFDLEAPRTAEPVPLIAGGLHYTNQFVFSPDGSWLAGVCVAPVVLWNMAGARSIVVGRQKPLGVSVAFTPDGRLVSASNEGVVRLWTLDPAVVGEGVQVLWSHPGQVDLFISDVDPQGRFVVMPLTVHAHDRHPGEGKVLLVPLDGSPVATHELIGRPGAWVWTGPAKLDPSGRSFAVVAYAATTPEETSLRIVETATGVERTLDTHPADADRCFDKGSALDGRVTPLWLSDGRLITDGDGGLRQWDLATGTSRQLRSCRKEWQTEYLLLDSRDPGTVVRLDGASKPGETSTLSVFDLALGTTREITSHGNRLGYFTLDSTGRILVTAGDDGVVRVGSIGGEEPHLLFGHAGTVWTVSVSPDGRWIASGGVDGTIRLWAMPDLSRPPLHTFAHDELLSKLRSLTNLRAVRDSSSDTGWKIEVGPFPGWATVPEWGP